MGSSGVTNRLEIGAFRTLCNPPSPLVHPGPTIRDILQIPLVERDLLRQGRHRLQALPQERRRSSRRRVADRGSNVSRTSVAAIGPSRPRDYCLSVTKIASSGERIREGEAALSRAAWGEARAIFEEELEERETVEALEGLSWAAWWVEDVFACIEARERAYWLSARQGDVRRAAMLAVWLGDDHLVLRGERAVANGWFQRATRLLERVETCPEHGWRDALVGYMALVEGDTARA